MITKIRDNLNDWDFDNPDRPESLTIFVSEDGKDVLDEELDAMNTRDIEGEHDPSASEIPYSIESIRVETDPMLAGSDVRVAPRDPSDMQPGYVEEPLVAHTRRCVFPKAQGPMLVARPWYQLRVPCDEHDGHVVEKQVPIITPRLTDDEHPPAERIYRQAAEQANEKLEVRAVHPGTGEEEDIEFQFEGILIA